MRNHLKAVLSIFLIVVLLLGVCVIFTGCGTMRKTEWDDQGLAYSLNEDGESYSVSGAKRTNSEVVIPETFNGKPVTVIEDKAFDKEYTGKEYTKISVPDSIELVGWHAFNKQDNLEYYEHYETVDGEEVLMWRYLGNEENNHVILLYTNESTYRMPEGTKVVYDRAFTDNVTSVSISAKLAYISPFAFANMDYHVDAGTHSVGIMNISVDDANPNFTDEGNLLLNADKTRLYYCCVTDNLDVNCSIILPSTLTYVADCAIPEGAFDELYSREGENVYLATADNPHFMLVFCYEGKAIHENTKVIAEDALKGVTSVTIPDSVIQIHTSQTKKLQSINITSKGWFRTYEYADGRGYDLSRVVYVDGNGKFIKNGDYEKIEKDFSDSSELISILTNGNRWTATVPYSIYRYE